jgi:flavin reductase
MTQVDPMTIAPLGVADQPFRDAAMIRSELRGVFGRFATGITVVTAGADSPHGMTANSFTSVSLDPPMVLVCVVKQSAMHTVITENGAFAVSMLSAHQEKVARYFADSRRPHGDREFDVVDSTPGRYTGAPILSHNLAWMECRLAAVYGGGDHSIFLGEVLDLGRGAGDDALLFYGGGFRRLESAVGER